MGDALVQPIPTVVELAGQIGNALSPQHESFCLNVASGKSYRKSAIEAGFHEQTGWYLMQEPHIRARIGQLAQDEQERNKAWLDNEWTRLSNLILAEDLDEEGRARATLRMTFLMNYAKYKGWIKERKQVERINVNMTRAEAAELLQEQMKVLPAAARRQIEASIVEAKAAVEPAPARSGKPKAK